MTRPTPKPTQTLDQEGFVSPKREEPPLMSAEELAQAAKEVFEDDLLDPEKVQAEIEASRLVEVWSRGDARATKPSGLHAKLAEVMAAVGRIPKNGKAPAAMGGYPFVEVGDAADAIRKELSSRMVSMLPERVEVVDLQTGGGAKGLTTTMTVMTTWRLTDGETGETAVIQSLGTGADNGDKYSPKAQTNSMKYALLMGFLLSTGDDPERFDLSEPAQGPGIEIGPSAIEGVRQGGRQGHATTAQIDKIREVAGQKELTPMALATFIGATLGGKAPDVSEEDDTSDQQRKILTFLGDLSFAECGQIVKALLDIQE